MILRRRGANEKAGSWLLASFLLALSFSLQPSQTRADDRKSPGELIKDRGFDVEEHDVISQYVYNLKVYHIINPLADRATLHKVPVVAMHGVAFDITSMMAASSLGRPRKPKVNERVTLYAMENGTDDRGLYFYLANNNYDVWLLEARATSDRVMTRLKDKRHKKSFWDFSADEEALIDLPTQIEYVRMKTQAPKVAYVAYSQSTLFMFMLLSMEPDFGNKLAAFVAVAPVFYTHHFRGIVLPSVIVRLFSSWSSANPLVPVWALKLWNFYTTYLCSISIFRESICHKIWSLFSGPDKHTQMEGGLVDNMFKETGLKVYEQALQMNRNKDVRMYDYKDEQRNMEEYGQIVPPKYNISRIKLRSIVLFRGVEDYLSDAQDQMLLISHLRVPLYEDHLLDDYAHMDFITSPTIVRDVNEPMLRALDVLTGRNVTRISHTLGEPNPQVIGTPLYIDLKPNKPAQEGDDKQPEQQQAQPNMAYNGDQKPPVASGSGEPEGTGNQFARVKTRLKSQSEAERPHEGVQGQVSETIREQLFGSRDKARDTTD